MQKVGLVKFKNKNIKYISKICANETFNINNNELNQISTTIINASIVHSEFLNNIDEIKLLLKVDVKIIYSRINDSSLYVEDKEFFKVAYIKVEKVIEGTLTQQAFIQKKLKIEIFTENIISKIIDNNVIVNFILLLTLSVNPSFYLAYNVDNGLFDNIFLSFSDGKNLTQKTFACDLHCTSIIWKPNSQTLVFTSVKDDHTNINVLNVNDKTNNNIVSVNVFGHVNNFTFIDNYKIMFDLQFNETSYLYTLNTKNKEVKRVDNLNMQTKYSMPYFDKNLKKAYFLSLIDNKDCLCSLNNKNSFDIIFNYENILDYIINSEGDKALIKILKDNTQKLFILNIDNKYLEPININFKYDSIVKFNFYDNKVIILFLSNSKYKLMSYNLHTFNFESLLEDKVIIDFCIDNHVNDLFISTDFNNGSMVIRKNQQGDETILTLPGRIKSLHCRI